MTDRTRRAPPPPPSSGFLGALVALLAFLAGDRDRDAAPLFARVRRRYYSPANTPDSPSATTPPRGVSGIFMGG
jgi:hypothetical protein